MVEDLHDLVAFLLEGLILTSSYLGEVHLVVEAYLMDQLNLEFSYLEEGLHDLVVFLLENLLLAFSYLGEVLMEVDHHDS